MSGMKYGKRVINDAFRKYVPKSDFAEDEQDAILEELYHKTDHEEVAQLPEKTLVK